MAPTRTPQSQSPPADGGVLCLHGFSGSPFEVQPLAAALEEAGYLTETPVLAGHGGTVADLAATRWPDWLASADAALTALRARVGGPVAIAGFSTGGLLALELAHRRPQDVAALVVMAAPLFLRRYQTWGVRLLARLPRPLRRGRLAFLAKLRGSDVSDREVRHANPCLPAMPIAGIASLLDLGRRVNRELPTITVPALVMHARHDHTVPIAASIALADRLGSPVVERLWLPRSFHLIAVDVERDLVANAACDWVRRHLANRSGEAARPFAR